jgi:uncharacterized cupin superfamily protein
MGDVPSKKRPSLNEIKEAKTWAIWEKEVSIFEWFYDDHETFYVLEGEGTVTWNGNSISFKQGDLVSFPKGLKCTWNVHKRLRKHYTFA